MSKKKTKRRMSVYERALRFAMELVPVKDCDTPALKDARICCRVGYTHGYAAAKRDARKVKK